MDATKGSRNLAAVIVFKYFASLLAGPVKWLQILLASS